MWFSLHHSWCNLHIHHTCTAQHGKDMQWYKLMLHRITQAASEKRDRSAVGRTSNNCITFTCLIWLRVLVSKPFPIKSKTMAKNVRCIRRDWYLLRTCTISQTFNVRLPPKTVAWSVAQHSLSPPKFCNSRKTTSRWAERIHEHGKDCLDCGVASQWQPEFVFSADLWLIAYVFSFFL